MDNILEFSHATPEEEAAAREMLKLGEGKTDCVYYPNCED